MGQSGKRRKKGRTAKSAASAAVPASAEDDAKITVDIHIGGIEFLEGSRKLDDVNGLAGGDAGPQGSLRYELAWADKAKVIDWFKAGSDQDHSAEMWFSAALSKSQRKELHSFCSTSCPGLKSVSRGTEEDRQIGIVHGSNSKWDIPALSDADEMKARALLGYLQDSGQTASVDEVRGMIANQSLSAELDAIVDQIVKNQLNVGELLDAVSSGQSEAVQSLLSASPGVVSIKQSNTGKLPLHTAAAAGNVPIMAMLFEAGASLEQKDGKDRTALEAARAAEQCDAEGWLLQQGVEDHAAQYELTEAANIAALDSAGPALASANGRVETSHMEEQTVASTQRAAVQTQDADPASHDAVGPATADPEEAVKSHNSSLKTSAEVAEQSAASMSAGPVPETVPGGASRDLRPITSDSCFVPDSQDEPAQGATQSSCVPGDSQATTASAHGVAPQSEAAMPKANRVPEIEPASPRPPRPGDVDGDFGMSIDEDEENGFDVLVDWAGNAATAVSDFCNRYPAIVATAGAMLAVAGAMVVKISSSSRR